MSKTGSPAFIELLPAKAIYFDPLASAALSSIDFFV